MPNYYSCTGLNIMICSTAVQYRFARSSYTPHENSFGTISIIGAAKRHFNELPTSSSPSAVEGIFWTGYRVIIASVVMCNICTIPSYVSIDGIVGSRAAIDTRSGSLGGYRANTGAVFWDAGLGRDEDLLAHVWRDHDARHEVLQVYAADSPACGIYEVENCCSGLADGI
ncbi:hypothetical protein BDV18DRAFT_142922, partial [Aspergillus unguis]